MAKVFIEETTLTAIGDAIREKTGGTDLIAPGNMPTEIKGIVSGGGSGDGDCNRLHIPEEALVITGDCQYKFYRGGWDWFIEECGNRITTKDITYTGSMFKASNLVEIPFALNYNNTTSSTPYHTLGSMFNEAYKLRKIPEMNNVKPNELVSLFNSCYQLEEFPDNFASNWDWSYYKSQSSQYNGNTSNMFNYCRKLRSLPTNLLKQENIVKQIVNSYCLYPYAFNCCYSLEKISLPVYNTSTWTSNAFNNTFNECYRLKELVFQVQEDGTPYTAAWKSQTIDLTKYVGWGTSTGISAFTNFTDDTKITTQSERQQYIQQGGTNPDAWADNVLWSTFGKTAAKKLFDTLPDTSEHLASAGGTNTVKLNGDAATYDAYDYMSDLTEEDIAVATAKGWTVTLT